MSGSNERSYLAKYSDEEITEAIKNSHSACGAMNLLLNVQFGGSAICIDRFIKEYNINIDHFIFRNYLRHSTDTEIIDAIKNSYSLSEAVAKLGYNVTERQRIAEFSKEHNISIEHFCSKNYKTYNVNDNFFSDLNELSCYWLGFIFADGNVREKGNEHSLKIHLAIKDEEHLKNFYKDIEYSGKLSYHKEHKATMKGIEYDCQPSVTAAISSKQISQDLIKLGCVPNKTKYGCSVSDLIPKELLRHFIRGVFDGDGSLVIDKRKNKQTEQLSIFILGDFNFLNQIKKIMMDTLGLNEVKISQRQGVCCLKWSGNTQCTKIFDWLYSDCVRWLPRKREKYDNFQASRVNRI